jgi:hypothetical protein
MADAEYEDKPAQTASGEPSASLNGIPKLREALMVAGGVVTVAAGVEARVSPLAKGLAILTITLAILAFGVLLLALYVFRQTKVTMTVGQIAECVTFVLLVAAALTYATLHHKATQSADGSPSPISRCVRPLTITSPANGTVIADGKNGVEVKIAACGLKGGDVGWLFDYDTGDGTYNFDGNGGPIVTTDGESTFADTPIGNPGDTHKLTVLTLVLAGASCNRTLTELQSGPPRTTLPSSCQVTSQIDVYDTYPQSNSG